MAKTIFDAHSGKLLGAHMVGAEVTELIQGFVIAMGLETTEEELVRTVFPHPALSELMHESVLDACGRAIHKKGCEQPGYARDAEVRHAVKTPSP